MSDSFRALEDRRSRVDQVRENSTRPGRAFAHYRTTGVGGFYERDVFDFGLAFIELPNFSFGASYDEDIETPEQPPTYAATVYKWRKTAVGFYTGAWVAFDVENSVITETDDFAMIFHLSWEGVASKDIVSTPGFPVNALDI